MGLKKDDGGLGLGWWWLKV